MKRLALFFLFISFFRPAFSQTVRGIVMDKSNNKKIDFASVYINDTYIGTNTDKNGYFELDISRYKTLPLTISALGYYSLTLTEFSTDKIIEVYLKPKIFELKEVVVEAKSPPRNRKKNLKIFRQQFLGISSNGQKCDISNENDIVFRNAGNTLIAYASKPLIITNYGLGYKLTYYLDTFEFNRGERSFLYQGNAIFNEDLSKGLAKKKFFDKRRKKAYLGSRNQFFSCLWSNSLKENGFVIMNSEGENIRYNDIVIVKSGSKKYLSYKGRIYIYYLSKSPNSYLDLLKNKVYFDRTGYFDGSGVKIIGQMAQQRVGDLLPYDYKVE